MWGRRAGWNRDIGWLEADMRIWVTLSLSLSFVPDQPQLALAHSTSRLSLLALPSLPPSEEVIDDDDGNEPSTSHASIVRTYKTSAIKPSNAHVSLNFLPKYVLCSLFGLTFHTPFSFMQIRRPPSGLNEIQESTRLP